MRSSESLTNIAPALVKALAKIEGAAKTANNSHFKAKYATLEAVIDASKSILAEHGLTLLQLPGSLANGVLTLETILLHESGEFISGDFGIALDKMGPQAVGSALTYARRYAQMSALNMPAVDDDGEAAQGRGDAVPTVVKQAPTHHHEGADWWGCSGSGPTANQAKKDKLDLRHDDLRSELGRLASAEEWRKWCAEHTAEIGKMPKEWRVILRAEAEEQARELGVDFNSRKAA